VLSAAAAAAACRSTANHAIPSYDYISAVIGRSVSQPASCSIHSHDAFTTKQYNLFSLQQLARNDAISAISEVTSTILGVTDDDPFEHPASAASHDALKSRGPMGTAPHSTVDRSVGRSRDIGRSNGHATTREVTIVRAPADWSTASAAAYR